MPDQSARNKKKQNRRQRSRSARSNKSDRSVMVKASSRRGAIAPQPRVRMGRMPMWSPTMSGKLTSQLNSAPQPVKAALLMMTMPGQAPSVRCPMSCCVPTAISTPFIRRALEFSTAKLDALSVCPAAGETSLFLSRDPLHSLIMFAANPDASEWMYDCYFEDDGKLSVECSPDPRGLGLSHVVNLPVVRMNSSVYAGYNYTWLNARNPIRYANTVDTNDGYKNVIWIDATSAHLTTVFVTCSTAMDINSYVDSYIVGETQTITTSHAWTGSAYTSCVFTVAQSGYYYFTVSSSRFDVNTKFQIRILGTTDLTMILPQDHVYDNEVNIGSIRTLGCSLLVSNRAQDDKRNGTIAGRQLNPTVSWNTSIGIDAITSGPNSESMEAKNGMYGFHRPDSSCFTMLKAFGADTYKIRDITLQDVIPVGGWMQISIKCQADSGSFPAATFEMLCVHSFEYTTNNSWLNTEVPSMNPNDFESLIVEVGKLSQFHENPLHFRDVMSFVRNIGKTAAAGMPVLANGLSAAFPQYAGIIKGISSLF